MAETLSTPEGKLARQAWMVAPETTRVMEALHLKGGSARFVGGCVRDALANRKVVDIDIATPLKPEEVIARLEESKINYAPTGLKHGTVTAIVDGRPFEITTLRVDLKAYGRHADVAFTEDWKADAARRDFTINAMSATLDGQVYDPFGGIADLRAGRVLFVGEAEKRIEEDYLRILRFFRFHAHFGKGPPDRGALAACAKYARKLSHLSAERIRQEVLKILEADAAASVWGLMCEKRIITQILPEATGIDILERLMALEKEFHTEAFSLRRLAALIVTNAEGLKHVTEALRLSNIQAAQLKKMVLPDPPLSLSMDEAEARRLVYREGNDTIRNLLLLTAARDGAEDWLGSLYDTATSFRPPRLPLRGEDAIELGLSGADVGDALKAVEDWWLDRDFRPTRTECLARLKEEAA
jgi:poly(A) polymerase